MYRCRLGSEALLYCLTGKVIGAGTTYAKPAHETGSVIAMEPVVVITFETVLCDMRQSCATPAGGHYEVELTQTYQKQ